jgi:hypothetical protein
MMKRIDDYRKIDSSLSSCLGEISPIDMFYILTNTKTNNSGADKVAKCVQTQKRSGIFPARGAGSSVCVTSAGMQELELIPQNESFPVSTRAACQVCDALAQDLQMNQWPVQSQVSADVLQLVVSAIKEETIQLTNENIEGLSALCDEFQFGTLSQCMGVFKTEM